MVTNEPLMCFSFLKSVSWHWVATLRTHTGGDRNPLEGRTLRKKGLCASCVPVTNSHLIASERGQPPSLA